MLRTLHRLESTSIQRAQVGKSFEYINHSFLATLDPQQSLFTTLSTMNPSHNSVLRSVARPNVLVFRASGTARLVTGRSIFGPRSSLISSTGHPMFSTTRPARKGMEVVFSPQGVTRKSL